MTDGQYGAYGEGYAPQQYAPAQYAYPKKKFPIQYIIIIALIAVLGIVVGGYFLGIFGGGAKSAAIVTPTTVNVQAAAGQTSYATFTIVNPSDREFSTSIDSTGLPLWINIDKTYVTLGPGESADIKIEISPASATDSTTAFLYFSNIDSFVSIAINVLPPADVRISLSRSTMQIYQGTKGSMLITASNSGQSPAANTTVSISGINKDWLSFDAGPFDVEKSGEKSIPVAFDIPADADSGTYESIITVKGVGFSKNTPFSLIVEKAVGLLSVSPDDISGTKNSGEVLKLTISNNGNAELTDVNITTTGSIGEIASFSTTHLNKLGAGQNTEVGMTLSGTNGTYTGSIEIKAADTHGAVQSQIVTLSITLT